MAFVVSINISEKKGTVKTPCKSGVLLENGGLSGDAHSSDGHRQLSLLASESYDEMRSAGAGLLPFGVFAENITTSGVRLHTLPVGTRLAIGCCEVEITQIGKECHKGCEIYKKVGKCVMPLQGVFARVITGGKISVNDEIRKKKHRQDKSLHDAL